MRQPIGCDVRLKKRPGPLEINPSCVPLDFELFAGPLFARAGRPILAEAACEGLRPYPKLRAMRSEMPAFNAMDCAAECRLLVATVIVSQHFSALTSPAKPTALFEFKRIRCTYPKIEQSVQEPQTLRPICSNEIGVEA